RRRGGVPAPGELRGGVDPGGRLVRLVGRPDRLAPTPALHPERRHGRTVVSPEPVLRSAPRLADDDRRGALPTDRLPPVLGPLPGNGQLSGTGLGPAEPIAEPGPPDGPATGVVLGLPLVILTREIVRPFRREAGNRRSTLICPRCPRWPNHSDAPNAGPRTSPA